MHTKTYQGSKHAIVRKNCLFGLDGSTLLDDAELNTLGLGKSNSFLLGVTNHEDVAQTSGKSVSTLVTEVGNLEATGVLLTTNEGTDTTNVSSTSDHAEVTNLELDVADDFASLKIDLDSVVDLDEGIGILDSAAIVSHDVRNGGSLAGLERVVTNGSFLGLGLLLDTAKFELGLLSLNGDESEATLDIIKQAEVLIGLVNGDDIHETSREVKISANFSVDFDSTAHDNHQSLAAGERILETVAEDEGKGKALTELVRTGGRARGPCSTELRKHPVTRSIDTF